MSGRRDEGRGVEDSASQKGKSSLGKPIGVAWVICTSVVSLQDMLLSHIAGVGTIQCRTLSGFLSAGTDVTEKLRYAPVVRLNI